MGRSNGNAERNHKMPGNKDQSVIIVVAADKHSALPTCVHTQQSHIHPQTKKRQMRCRTAGKLHERKRCKMPINHQLQISVLTMRGKTILSSLLLMLSAMPAHCDDNIPADSIWRNVDLEQVVVTGTRTPKLLAQTPVLTQVISQKDIQKLTQPTSRICFNR